MSSSELLWPLLGLVIVTFCVWLRLFTTRIQYMQRNRIDPEAIPHRAQSTPALAEIAAPSDNMMNLFELPVLFYALIAVLLTQGEIHQGWLYAAWSFVLLRAVHSLIHCTYNRVMHRFIAYLLSSLVLWGMWVAFALSLL